MSTRVSKGIALLGATAVLAIGGAGVAQASPDHNGGHRHRDDACKKLKGKKRRHCEHRHHGSRR